MNRLTATVGLGALLAAPMLFAGLAAARSWAASPAQASGQDEVDTGSLQQAREAGCSRRAHRMLHALADGDFERATAMFSESSRRVVTPDRLQQIWTTLGGQYGEHVRLGRGSAAISAKKGYYLAGVPMQYEQATLTANVMCDEHNDIVDFKITRAPEGRAARQ